MSLPIYVINRPADTDRLAQFDAAATDLGLSFTTIPAFDGHSPTAPWFLYRDLIGDRFWGGENAKPGALACFISHIAAWRRLLADGSEMALICEDDAVLKSKLIELRSDARRNEGFDVIFANERMVGWRERHAAKSDKKLISVEKVMERLRVNGGKPGDAALSRAPGGDAYLISRSGAQKLLTAIASHRITAGVDWAMLALGLSAEERSASDLSELQWLSSQLGAEPNLNILVAKTAVAAQNDQASGGSVIRHSTEVSIEKLKSKPSLISEASEAEPPEDPHILTFPSGPEPDLVFRRLQDGEFYEAPALEMMMRWMPPNGVFIDIGAHVGVHSLFMARHGGAGMCVPIECNRHVLEALVKAVETNNLFEQMDMTKIGFGAWVDKGKKEQIGPKRIPFEARLREGFVEDVKVRPGFNLLRDHKPDMIKIDVNGEEREVLKGLRRTIKRRQPLIALDLTRPKSSKSMPLLERLHYQEVESASWREGEEDKVFAIFRHVSQSPQFDAKKRKKSDS